MAKLRCDIERIWEPLHIQHGFVHLDVNDHTHELCAETELESVYQLAFEHHGKLLNIGRHWRRVISSFSQLLIR